MRSARHLVLLAALAVLLASGCADDFPSGGTVEAVRVLAVRAEPPDLPPGGETTLTALVATPGGDLTGVTLDWSVCDVGRSGNQANPSPDACSDPALARESQSQAATGLPPGDPYLLTVPPLEQLDPDAISQPDATGGVYLAVRLVARRADEPPVVTLYRLRLQLGQTTVNRNPVFDGELSIDGQPWAEDAVPSVAPGARLLLEARWEDGAEEDYQLMLPGDEPRQGTEVLSFAWFDDQGQVDPEHTGGAGMFEATWQLPDEIAVGSRVHLWVVLRDNRGGAAWMTRQVEVGSP
jgi:hypothetical protein